jgi:hypothetical protein
VRYQANGLSVADVALLMGVSVEYVERELSFDRLRGRRCGDFERRMLAAIGDMRKTLARARKRSA